MTRAESALKVAKELARAAAELDRLTRELNAEDCQGVPGRTMYDPPASHLDEFLEWNRRALSGSEWGGDGTAREKADRAFDAMRACPTCRAKWDALQDRKALRRRRGSLRAALVRIGKLALKDDAR